MGYVNIVSRKAERPGGKEYGPHSNIRSEVVDAETGKPIDGIRSIVISLHVEEAVTAEIEIYPNSVNIEHVKANFRIVDISEIGSKYRKYTKVPESNKELQKLKEIAKTGKLADQKEMLKMNWFKKILWNLFFKDKNSD